MPVYLLYLARMSVVGVAPGPELSEGALTRKEAPGP